MHEPTGRPDPDVLLRRVQDDAARARRGRLTIFFGFAPGVGKTYRMLQVAGDLQRTRQVDVVVGLVEDHARADTAALAAALPHLPRRRVSYHGRVLEEFDLDAARARKPALVLVDELAHTNAPGGRHAKRWQDVEELRDAGIDVFTTLNVQHLESLNDVVAQITHVAVRETVPDGVLDDADAIELVDIAPEALLARLAEGKVYLPDQAQRAAAHFFQRGNLLALRELALRRAAQHVDDDVRAYREAHGVASTWPAGERILVCVGPAPSSGRLIRAAARMAAGLRCPWVAVYAETTTSGALSKVDRERLERHLRLAESLGATVTRVASTRIAEALLQYARKHNVTRIVIGKPTHSRLRDRLRGSLLDEVVRGSGDIDVHVIRGDDVRDTAQRDERPPARAPAWKYGAAALSVAATLGLCLLLRQVTDLPDLEMLFLLNVMLTAVLLGRGPSIATALLGVAAYDFFFVPPHHTFFVSDRRYVLTFGMMLGVGFAMSELASRLRRQEQAARSREERTAVLYALTRELAASDLAGPIADTAARHAADIFHARAVLLGASADGSLQVLAASSKDMTLAEKELGVAQWSAAHGALAGRGTDTLPGATILCAPLRAGAVTLGVLALGPRDANHRSAALQADQRAFLDVFTRQVASALERARLSDEAKQAAVRARSEEMRASLLSAVSHDLRTPLASITGAATSLRDDVNLSVQTKGELVSAIVGEAERLERLVANLLDMTRLDAGAVALKVDWVPLDELIGAALTRLEARLEQRAIRIEIADDVPLLRVDPVLFAQVFVNLLENADKYTSRQTPLDIRAERDAAWVVITVRDHGPGLPEGAEARVFEKFYRGPHPGVAGAGLGLAICKAIIEAHGGSIRAVRPHDGGACFIIRVPSGGTPPALPAAGEHA